MNAKIREIVEQFRMLHFQVNKGKRHRIMRSGIRRGSLWVTPRTKGYCIAPTGEVEEKMESFLRTNFGAESGRDTQNRWKYWNISDIADVSKIIRRFGEA